MAETVPRKSDKREVVTRRPKAQVFNLGDAQGNSPDLKAYNALLADIHEGKKQLIGDSGIWHEGQYHIQVHYYEVEREEKLREDTDFESAKQLEEEQEEREAAERKRYEEKIQQETEDMNNAVQDDSMPAEETPDISEGVEAKTEEVSLEPLTVDE